MKISPRTHCAIGTITINEIKLKKKKIFQKNIYKVNPVQSDQQNRVYHLLQLLLQCNLCIEVEISFQQLEKLGLFITSIEKINFKYNNYINV